MRILMVSDVYFPRINGVSTSIKTFREELAELGHEVVLIAPEYGAEDEADKNIIRIPSRYVFIDPEDRMMKQKNIIALADRLKKMQFDILHIQTPFVAHYAGIRLSHRLNIPRIATYHTHFEEYLFHYLPYFPKSTMRYVARAFNRSQCNDVDALIVPSQAMLDVLRNYGVRKPIDIIATGLDHGFFKPGDRNSFRKKYGISDKRQVIIHIGRVAHEKNIDFLLYMLNILRQNIPDILLVITGEGPAEDHLKNLIRTLNLQEHVLFVGYLERNTCLLDCYSAGDVFVFSSKTETQGLVLLEAMAQGVPVVSIAALGTNDILQAGKGALIAQDDTHDFSGKVLQLLQDKTLHTNLAHEAREYAKTWSSRKFATKKASFYERTIQFKNSEVRIQDSE